MKKREITDSVARHGSKPLILWLMICLRFATPLYATAHFLSPTGSDNASGTFSAPWKTLSKANQNMGSGDTLFMRGGNYWGDSNIQWTAEGNAAKPLVVKPYLSEVPVFNGNGANWLLTITGNYAVFEGFEVTNYTQWAFMPDGGARGLVFRNCYLHDILAVEVGAITPKSCSHVTIENCIFERMGRSLTQTAYDHALYNAAGSHDITIRNNIFRDNYGGPAINHYHTPSPYNIWIYNNVFIMRKGAERSGIFTGDGTNHVHVYNNTFYAEGTGSSHCSAILFNSGHGTNVAVNNIIYFSNWDIKDAIWPANGDTIDYNMYFPQKDSDDEGTHSFAADPLFVDVSADNFHLSSNSPAINKGYNVGTPFDSDFDGVPRPQGTSTDIGAYETATVTVNRAKGKNYRDETANAMSTKNIGDRIEFALPTVLSGTDNTIVQLDIFNYNGSLIRILDIEQGRATWNIATVPNGSYIAKTTFGTKSICQRVFITR